MIDQDSFNEVTWNAEAVSVGLNEIAGCRGQLLVELKRLLDDYHCWDKTTHFYDIIAGDWLEDFAHLTYAAMVEGPLRVKPDSADDLIPVSSDLIAHSLLRWQRSGLHEHLRRTVAAALAGESPASWKFSTNAVNIVSGGRKQIALTASRFIATARPKVLLVAPSFKCGRTEAATTLFRWRRWAALESLEYPIQLSSMVDQKWRTSQACNAAPAIDLLSVLRVLLPLHLPVALLEGFAIYRDATLAMPVARPKVVYSANALHGNLPFKILTAEWREEGTLLFYHQHGGGYAIDRLHAIEDFETRVSDRYFTWGWRNPKSPRIQPLSPASLYSPARKRTHVLLTCVEYPKVVHRLHFQPMPGTIQKMHRDTCAFLASFPACKNLLIRPSPNDYGWGFVEKMRETAPDASFDDRSANIFDRYAQSRLVVHNYLGTGYLETLALNVPTICFFDINIYAFRREAQPLMDALEHVGILHRTGRAAALFAASLCDDPDGWWSSSEVQQARLAFIDQYANFSPNWAQQWEAEFRNCFD